MPELLRCAVCNNIVSSDAIRCPHCGTSNYKTTEQKKKEQVLRDWEFLKKKKEQEEKYGPQIKVRIKLDFLNRRSKAIYDISCPILRLDNEVITGVEEVILSPGYHTIELGIGAIGYSSIHDAVSRKIEITKNTKEIVIIGKYNCGFWRTIPVQIMSINIVNAD